MRLMSAILALLLPAMAWADSVPVFKDYAAYSSFMDEQITTRDVAALLAGLGAGGELSDDELAALQNRVDEAFPEDLSNVTVSREVDLGGGLHQELRVYWSDDAHYLFIYALYHDRGDDMIILQFEFDSDPETVMAAF